MNAKELFKAGQLQNAISAQINEVKTNPADQSKRLFLFELLVFQGDLDRARRQIDAIQHDEIELEAATQTYRKLLDSEQARRQLFQSGVAPQFFGEPSEHLRLRLEALNRLRENRPAEAAESLEKAATACPPLQGELNGKSFHTLRDCDDLLSSVLEVMAHGKYYWVGLEQIDTVAMNPPQFPRDLLWIPTKLLLREGATGDVFVPALYPGSHEHADDQVKLGRMTDWKGAEGEPVLGAGLRTYLVDEDPSSVLEWRQLVLQAGGSPS